MLSDMGMVPATTDLDLAARSPHREPRHHPQVEVPRRRRGGDDEPVGRTVGGCATALRTGG